MSQLQQLEQQLANAKKTVETRDLVNKLLKNADFRKVILEGFCTSECAIYAHTSADPSLTREQRDDAMGMAQAAGHLKRYLAVKQRMGEVAERDVAGLEQAIDEARAEEVESVDGAA